MKYIAPIVLLVAIIIHVNMDQLYMAPHVKQYVQQISHLPSETSACLEYVEFQDNIYVYNYYIPETVAIGKSWVVSKKCAPGEISFHNHPYQELYKVQKYYSSATKQLIKSKNQMMYLSRPDIMGVLKQQRKYTMVATNGNYAWWSLDQIDNTYLQLPIKEQTSIIDPAMIYATPHPQ